jgi:hypothetical protein
LIKQEVIFKFSEFSFKTILASRAPVLMLTPVQVLQSKREKILQEKYHRTELNDNLFSTSRNICLKTALLIKDQCKGIYNPLYLSLYLAIYEDKMLYLALK